MLLTRVEIKEIYILPPFENKIGTNAEYCQIAINMRVYFENVVTALIALICLILSVFWYINTKDIEPLISIVTTFGLLATSLACISTRMRVKPDLTNIDPNSKGEREVNNNNSVTTIANSSISAGGNIQITNQNNLDK